MEKIKRIAKRSSCLRDNQGYSLVELMGAIGITLIIGLAVYSVFSYGQRSGQSQKIYNDLQTNCNFALDQMKSELLLAGYHAPPHANGSIYAVGHANGSIVTFEYYDDNARDNEAPYTVAAGYDKNTQVTYTLEGSDLVREFSRHLSSGEFNPCKVHPGSTVLPTKQTLATHIGALNFRYFMEDNVEITSLPVPDPDLGNIRTVRVSLTCNASRSDPNTKEVPQLTLVADVRARNLGVAGTATDTTPPATPSGLIAWDPGECGKLELRWNANNDADIEGYTVYYGLAAGTYSERQVVSGNPGGTGGYEYLTVTGLASSVTGVTPKPQYYFKVAAFDKSGNVSAGLSNEATGDPMPTVAEPTGCGSASCASDTTPTPRAPDAPAGFTATAGNNAITLTWTKSGAAGLLGYRLYRSTSPSFTPDETAGTGNIIADEVSTPLGPESTSFTHTGLEGCTTYYYKLTVITCDSALPIASRQFSDASAMPDDNDKPPAPSLTARPGYRRIIVNLWNPLADVAPDFVYTKIFWSTTDFPTPVTVTPKPAPGQPRVVVTDSPPIPDTDTPGPPFLGANGTDHASEAEVRLDPWAGRFEDRSTKAINFNNATNGDRNYTNPDLVPCLNWPKAAGDPCQQISYYFVALAYDKCGNASDVTASSVVKADECSDCVVGEDCYGAPWWTSPGAGTGKFAAMDDANLEAAGCNNYITLSWNEIDSTLLHDDLAGYHIYRCDGASVCPDGTGSELTAGLPIWGTTFNDSSRVPGQIYSYRLQATDCYYERHISGSDNNYTFDTIQNLSVGLLERDTTLSPVSGYLPASTTARPFTVSAGDGLTSDPPTFQHNTVTLWARNTAATPVTLNQLTLGWENPQAYLQKFAFGDDSTTPVTIAWSEDPPLTHTGSGGPVILDAGSRFLANDEKIPVVTLFKNANGSVTRDTDSRQQTLNYTFNYRNDWAETGTSCNVLGSIYVPLGPYIYITTQDQPAAGTVAWPVPGDQGTNLPNNTTVVDSTPVTVYTNVFDSSGTNLTTYTPGNSPVKLYYYVADHPAVPDPSYRPPAPTGQYPNISNYTRIDMVWVAGNQWRTPPANPIPANNGKDVWYFIVALDSNGNFDREPEIDSGAFQYFQSNPDPCLTTPKPPTGFSGTRSGSSIVLGWVAPTQNTNNTSYTDQKGYQVGRGGGTGSFSWSTNDKNILTVTDPAPNLVDDYTYTYWIRAFDQCATPKYSSYLYWSETEEDSCSNTPQPPVLSGTTDDATKTVTLTWTAPTKNTTGTTLKDLAGYSVWRRAGTAGIPALVADTTTATLSYPDTVADLGDIDYQYCVEAFDSCSSGAKKSVCNWAYTDSYTSADPCLTQPGNVTGFSVNAANTTIGVSLQWAAPVNNVDGSLYVDANGYMLERCEWNGTVESNCAALTDLAADLRTYIDDSVKSTVGDLTYRYKIKAFDRCGTRRESPDWVYAQENFTDGCPSIPPAPGTFTVGVVDDTGVNLSWTAPSPYPADLVGYRIERKEGAGAYSFLTNRSAASISYKDPVTNAWEKVYSYRIQAYDNCSPTPNPSSWVEVQETYAPCTGFPTPGTPTALVAAAPGGSEKCRSSNSPYSPVTTKAKFEWTANATPPATPIGTAAISFEITTCSTSGCTPGTAASFSSAIANTSGNYWTATLQLDDFLANKVYTIGVKQVYTKDHCVTKSPMATTTDTCN